MHRFTDRGLKIRFAILLILLYLIPSVGMCISVHKCGNKITKISFFIEDNGKRCKCSSRKMKPDCCKEKTEFVKLTDLQQKADNYKPAGSFIKKIVKTVFNSIIQSITIRPKFVKTVYNSKPPDVSTHQVFLKNRVLLI